MSDACSLFDQLSCAEGESRRKCCKTCSEQTVSVSAAGVFFFLLPLLSQITRVTKDWLLGLCVVALQSLKNSLSLSFSVFVPIFLPRLRGSYVRRLLAASLLVPRETGTVSSPHVSPSPVLLLPAPSSRSFSPAREGGV